MSRSNKPAGGVVFKLIAGLLVVAVAAYFGSRNPKGSGVHVETSGAHEGNPGRDGLAMPDAATPPTKGEAEAARRAQPAAPEAARPPAPAATGEAVDPGTIRYGERTARTRTPGTVRVATFNIENLFDDKDDPALSGSGEDATMTKPQAHLAAAARALRELNADIVALQEVESEQALRWFRDNHLQGMGYDHVVSIDAGDRRGIEQSVLSRYPLSGAKVHRFKLGGRQPDTWGRETNRNAGQPFEFTRGPLEVTVEVPASAVTELLTKAGKAQARAESYKLTLVVVHAKSGRDFEAQREAEAKGVVSIVRQIEKDRPAANVLVLGDFNATLNRESMVVYASEGLPSIFQDRNPRDERTMTHASARSIDHIFYNPAVKPELRMDSRFVLGLPARPQGADWNTTPAPAGYASDHYPVAIDLVPVEAR